MTTYSMTPINNGTRVRDQPNTAGKELTRVNADVPVIGTELFIADKPLSNIAGVYQMIGDKWLKISYNGVTGWMAYIHKGEPICYNFKMIDGTTPVPSEPVFPLSYILTDPAGNKAEFIFVRIVE